jgi:hypothetical protein
MVPPSNARKRRNTNAGKGLQSDGARVRVRFKVAASRRSLSSFVFRLSSGGGKEWEKWEGWEKEKDKEKEER